KHSFKDCLRYGSGGQVFLCLERRSIKEAKKEMKGMFGLAPKLLGTALLFFFIACASSTVRAQDVVYDWAGRKVLIAPTKVNRATPVNLIIKNDNNVLYEYRISVTA